MAHARRRRRLVTADPDGATQAPARSHRARPRGRPSLRPFSCGLWQKPIFDRQKRRCARAKIFSGRSLVHDEGPLWATRQKNRNGNGRYRRARRRQIAPRRA